MATLIEIKNLKKHYQLGNIKTPVLHGIDFEIQNNEFLTIMGPSGSGKSTLMNIIGMLDIPSSGSYKFNNQCIEKYSEEQLAEIRNKKLGFVFQMFNLLPRMSALENVTMPLMYSGVKEPEQIERGKELLNLVGLSHRLEHKPSELSGGEQQRVAIARALVNKPQVILADEPTGNLDSKTSYEIMEIFCNLHYNQKYTIIMITHEPDIAEYSERIIMLKDGKVESDAKQPSCGIKRYGLRNGIKKLHSK